MSPGPNPVPPQIIDAAAHWFIAMREPVVPEDRRAAFAEWLRASPVHMGAYLEIARVWGDAAHIGTSWDLDSDDIGAQNVIPLQAADAASVADAAWQARSPRLHRRALAAAIFLATTLIALLAWWQIGRAPSFATLAGEQRVLTLDDGSIVRLNSRSKVRVRLTPQLRRIDLEQGQALFEVAKDPTRPFVVYSEGVVVRAVGTQFDMYRKNEGTVVTVVEGRVALVSAGARPPSEAALMQPPREQDTLVAAGEQVTVHRSGALERRAHPNIAAATSWLQQELVFDGQPLSAVIDEFNRYARIPIVLDDQSLADIRVNAVFHATDIEPLLHFISRYDGVRIERTSTQIRIARDPSVTEGSAAAPPH